MRRYIIATTVIIATLLAFPLVATAQDDDGQVIMTEVYRLEEGERIGGDLVVIAREAIFENGSRVDGDLTVMAETVKLHGRVGGDVVILAGEFELGRGANIRGDLNYCASRAELSDGAYVAGSRSQECGTPLPEIARLLGGDDLSIYLPDILGPHMTRGIDVEIGRRTAIAEVGYDPIRIISWAFTSATILALLGALTLMLWPDRVELVRQTIESAPVISGGLGFLTLLVGFLAGAAFLIICGLGVAVWALMLAALVLGWSGWGMIVGRWATRQLDGAVTPLATLVIGLFGFSALTGLLNLIPVLGTLVSILLSIVISSVGLGAVALTHFGGIPYQTGPRGHQQALPQPISEAPTRPDDDGPVESDEPRPSPEDDAG